jgi:hypothetical protein
MAGHRFKDVEHLLRVAGLLLVGVVLFLGLKALLVPKDFGLYGHYRAGALDDARARPVVFAGRAACEACHSEVPEATKGGKHAGIACEACHGALAPHAEADDPAATKPPRPTAALCPVCHSAAIGKPARFPQVNLKEHAEPGTCLECHRAHRPSV